MTTPQEKTILRRAGWVVLAALLSTGAVQSVDVLRTADQHHGNAEIHRTRAETDQQYVPREVIETRLKNIEETLRRIEEFLHQ